MIARIKLRGFVAESGAGNVHNQPKAVYVRQYSRERNQPTIASVIGCFRSNYPTARR